MNVFIRADPHHELFADNEFAFFRRLDRGLSVLNDLLGNKHVVAVIEFNRPDLNILGADNRIGFDFGEIAVPGNEFITVASDIVRRRSFCGFTFFYDLLGNYVIVHIYEFNVVSLGVFSVNIGVGGDVIKAFIPTLENITVYFILIFGRLGCSLAIGDLLNGNNVSVHIEETNRIITVDDFNDKLDSLAVIRKPYPVRADRIDDLAIFLGKHIVRYGEQELLAVLIRDFKFDSRIVELPYLNGLGNVDNVKIVGSA